MSVNIVKLKLYMKTYMRVETAIQLFATRNLSHAMLAAIIFYRSLPGNPSFRLVLVENLRSVVGI